MIGITDNELSPLVGFRKRSLLVEVGEVSFTDFYAAAIALAKCAGGGGCCTTGEAGFGTAESP